MRFKLSRYVLISDPLDEKDDIRTERIVYSTRTGKGIKISNYAISLISNQEFLEIPDRLFTILMYHEIIVPEDEDELRMVVNRKLLTARDTPSMQSSFFFPRDHFANPLKNDDAVQLEKSIRKSVVKRRPNGSYYILIAVEIADLKHGLEHFNTIWRFVNNLDLGPDTLISYRLIHTASVINDLLFCLPLANPKFDSLALHFSDHDADNQNNFADYLNTLLLTASKLCYFQQLQVSCYFSLKKLDRSVLAETGNLMKELAGLRNVSIFIDLPIRHNESAAEHHARELTVLKMLQQSGIKALFLPAPDEKFKPQKSSPDDLFNSSVSREGKDLLSAFCKSDKGTTRSLYSDNFAASVQKPLSVCGQCVYLPICGGMELKTNTDDCPPFTRNFMKKVEYMYDFSIDNLSK